MDVILHLPSTLPDLFTQLSYNILMIDTSTSMSVYWSALMNQWNKYMAPILEKCGNETVRYTFSDVIEKKGCSPQIQKSDFRNSSTDLIGALKKIQEEIESCQSKDIKVFFITDGFHSVSRDKAETQLEKMKCPVGKKCEFFVLGIGKEYPVKQSLFLQAQLNTGNTIPNLFQVLEMDDMEDVMKNISSHCSSVKIRLSVEGSLLPGGTLESEFYLDEYVYLKQYNGEKIYMFTNSKTEYILHLQFQDLNVKIMDQLITQWNRRIIQIYNKDKENFFFEREIINIEKKICDELFLRIMNIKDVRGNFTGRFKGVYTNIETNLREKINGIKKLIEEGQYLKEIELAGVVLNSITVSSHYYSKKAYQLKGYTDNDFKKDIDDFVKIFEKVKHHILALQVLPENCCRISLTSTVSDLQEPKFLTLLNSVNKFQLSTVWNITGIPVLFRNLNCTVLNIWSYNIIQIVEAPFDLIGVTALVDFVNIYGEVGHKYNEIEIINGKQETRFNAIIPIFTPEEAHVMGSLMETNLFAKMMTFAVLRNPIIKDHNAHLGSLAVLLIKLFEKYPIKSRPKYVCRIINSIQATVVNGYMKRWKLKKYWEILKSENNINQALMTESILKFDGISLKCETLIKPMFIMYMMMRDNNPESPQYMKTLIKRIMKIIILEYVGRCVCKGKFEYPYSHFFITPDKYKKEKQKCLEHNVEESEYNIENYYTLHEVRKALKHLDVTKLCPANIFPLKEIQINGEKIAALYSWSHAGDLSLKTLRIFVIEMMKEFEEYEIELVLNELFNDIFFFKCLYHALKFPSSRERLKKFEQIEDYDKCRFNIRNEMIREVIEKWNLRDIYKKKVEKNWVMSYMKVHQEILNPMTPKEIMDKVHQMGLFNCEKTSFHDIYIFRYDVKILTNACQISTCPYYLIPSKNCGQHLFIERSQMGEAFPHALHKTAHKTKYSIKKGLEEFQNGTYTKKGKKLLDSTYKEYKKHLIQLQKIYKHD